MHMRHNPFHCRTNNVEERGRIKPYRKGKQDQRHNNSRLPQAQIFQRTVNVVSQRSQHCSLVEPQKISRRQYNANYTDSSPHAINRKRTGQYRKFPNESVQAAATLRS